MAKLPSRTALTTLADGDLVHWVDVSDTTADPAGTSKKVTATNVAVYTATKNASATQTLTNKTFDANGTGNSLSNVETADIASGSKSGADATLLTGTAGTNGNLGSWNVDGDLVDASVVAANVVTAGSAYGTDNVIVRSDGTSKATQATGIVISDTDEISGYLANVNVQTGTTYTLLASDEGKVITLNNAAAITVTAPNSLSVGFTCTLVQIGAGQVTISAGASATVNNRQSHTKIAGQYGMASLVVYANSGGSAAVYALGGDTAA